MPARQAATPIADVESLLLSHRPPGLSPSSLTTPKVHLPSSRSKTGVATVCTDIKCLSLPTQAPGRCIRALANYTPRRPYVRYPREKCAAVLVALFVGRKGDLYVLLSRYATHRTEIFHPVTVFQTSFYLTNLCR